MESFGPESQILDVLPETPNTMYPILTQDEKKKLEAQLILSTTYPLNQSETKRITVGLQTLMNGSIRPIIKLQNNNSPGGVIFESLGFSSLQNNLPKIADYFVGGQNPVWGSSWRTPSPIRIDECEIIFTTAFGAKSIVFDVPTTEQDENSEPPRKKARTYSPSVVMQKTTFEGLCNILPVVEERFRRLQRVAPHVNMCIHLLCAELILHIPQKDTHEKIDELRIKDLIKNNYQSLKEAVKMRLDATFVENYFGVVFMEATIWCVPFVTNELKKAVVDQRE